jgi:hypothetical protein
MATWCMAISNPQLPLTTFYLAVGVFVATSVSIGVVEITNQRYGWIPVVLGLMGACFLFYDNIPLLNHRFPLLLRPEQLFVGGINLFHS